MFFLKKLVYKFKTQYCPIHHHMRRVLHSVQPIRASFSPSTTARVRMFCLAETKGRVFTTLKHKWIMNSFTKIFQVNDILKRFQTHDGLLPSLFSHCWHIDSLLISRGGATHKSTVRRTHHCLQCVLAHHALRERPIHAWTTKHSALKNAEWISLAFKFIEFWHKNTFWFLSAVFIGFEFSENVFKRGIKNNWGDGRHRK